MSPRLTKDDENTPPYKWRERACPELVSGVGMGFSGERG